MTVELMNPPGIPEPVGYAQVGVGTGSRMVFVSGQVARTAEGTPVGAGDLRAQAEQAYANLVTAIGGAGATFADVVKLTVYVVDWAPEKMEDLVAGAMAVAARTGIDPVRPITLVGVVALGEPDMLVEVEAVAVVD